MNTFSTPARLALAASLVIGLGVVAAQPASADEAPQANDVVGVGSDIIQNSLDFLADGDTNGNSGYNTVGNKYRLISFDATADGNGRNSFSDPGVGTSVALNPTITLRAGTTPVQRPNGGTAGLTALTNDGQNGKSSNEISFARSPNLPTAAQQQAAQSNLGSPLHTIQFATDKQVVATAATTNAPTLSVQQLVCIYSGNCLKWTSVGGTSSDTIIPEIPQTSAGVYKIFINALKAANGGTAVTLANPNIVTVQQNDPTSITGLSSADQPNAIVPFPIGRYKLLKSGYFHDPNTAYSQASPPAALDASGIKLITTGTASDSNAAFGATIPYYVIFRQSDYSSTTAWQPGSTLNWVQTLFASNAGNTPYIESAPAQAILTAEGLTVAYNDLGTTSSG